MKVVNLTGFTVFKNSLGSCTQLGLINYSKRSLQSVFCRRAPICITFVLQNALCRRRPRKFVQFCVTFQILLTVFIQEIRTHITWEHIRRASLFTWDSSLTATVQSRNFHASSTTHHIMLIKWFSLYQYFQHLAAINFGSTCVSKFCHLFLWIA